SVITVQQNFRTRFHKDLPDPKTIRRLVTTGCLCKGKSPGRPRVPQAPRDFYLWGYVKDHVFVPPLPENLPVTRPHRQRHRCNRHGNTSRVWDELHYRLDVCRVTRGAHFEHL
ncbi:hypothetical protein C0J52_20251, partial [Blattella germanica]